jgi:NitT/TauT family transport system substrate-binding protein
MISACGSQDGSTSSSGGAGNGIAGSRFTMMFQSTATADKVVEVHAVNLLKAQGVKTDIKWNPSSANIAITELTNGQIDTYSQAVTGGVGAAVAGVKIKDFALAQPRQNYVVLAKKGITSLAGLKGKTIGVSSITGVNYAQALMALQTVGLSVKDVQIVVAGGQSTRVSGLAAGRMDATMLSHGAELQLAPQGFTSLFDYTKQASNLYDDNVFATPDWLAKHGKLAIAFNKALLQSFTWFNNPANADQIVTEALAIDPAADKAQTAALFKVLRDDQAYPEGTILDPSLLDQQQKLYMQAGALKGTLPVDQWVDDSFAKQAKAEG